LVDGVSYCVRCVDEFGPRTAAAATASIPVVNIATAARASFGQRLAAFTLDVGANLVIGLAIGAVYWLWASSLPNPRAPIAQARWASYPYLCAAATAAYFI